MTLKSELAELEDRVAHIVQHATLALTTARDRVDECDSLPKHTIGASAPTAGPPVIYEGNCNEPQIHGGILLNIPCGHLRPCPEHDTAVTLTPVEQDSTRVGQRMKEHEHLTHVLTELIRYAKAAQIAVNRYITKPDNTDKHCRSGKSTDTLKAREGAVECRVRGCTCNQTWSDPTCDRLIDPTCDGLCRPCFDREHAWRTAHQLEPLVRQARCIRDCGRPATDRRNDHLCDACHMADSRARARKAS